MSLTLLLSLFYFTRVIESVTLRMRKYLFKRVWYMYQNFKTQKLLLKNTLFCLVSGHQPPCSIPRSLSKLVLGVSLVLTHTEPMFPFGIPWKHKKTLRFSDFFRASQKGTLTQYGLSLIFFLWWISTEWRFVLIFVH